MAIVLNPQLSGLERDWCQPTPYDRAPLQIILSYFLSLRGSINRSHSSRAKGIGPLLVNVRVGTNAGALTLHIVGRLYNGMSPELARGVTEGSRRLTPEVSGVIYRSINALG